MTNYYLLFRSLPFLFAAQSSMLHINEWLSVMIGPDCWDYSPEELGVVPDEKYGVTAGSGQRFGIDVRLLDGQPLAQSLKYAVSGVGVHILFIALGMIYLAFCVPARDRRAPLALLLLDLLTLANATGSFDQDTAGHPRCLDDAVSLLECGKGLQAFAPVVALDVAWMIVTLVFPGAKASSTSKKSD